jgi:hypothetical protein
MTVAPVWKYTGIGLLALALAGSARAEDQIKPGKWEFHVEIAMPNMPKLPPGIQLPPGVQMGAGGMSVVHTSCITEKNPLPPDNHLPKPGDQDKQCKINKMDRGAGSIAWNMDCQSPQGTWHSEGEARYHGDTMEATFKSRMAGGPAPGETSQHVTGRYLGPCDK